MTPVDPRDQPTERLAPREPHAREGAVPAEAAPPAEAAAATWVARLEDQVRTLKGVAALLGALTIAALALAAWALLSGDDDEGQSASADRVARLDDRVDRLEDDVAELGKQTDTADVAKQLDAKADQADLDALQQQVDQLQGTVEELANAGTADQVAELQTRVDTLARDLEALTAGGP